MTDARTLTTVLSGRWWRGYGSAPCPVCQPERHNGKNALTLKDGRDGRLLAHCKKSNCAFADILKAAGIGPGDFCPPDPLERARRETERQAATTKRARLAARCWQEAQPIQGTLAETYLRRRGITCPLASTLRFHPECWHGPTAKRYPAMVALVEGGDGFAVHRTYLRGDGTGKAPIDAPKMMLGAVTGGAVRLTNGPSTLVVSEGIETALSLGCGLLRAKSTIWAALSTSGLQSLRLPPSPAKLIIAPDGDPAGKTAAQTLAARAHATGWRVSLLPAPEGRDWNDVLQLKGDAA